MLARLVLIFLLIIGIVGGALYYRSNKTVTTEAIKGALPAIVPVLNQEEVLKEAKDETNLGLTIPKGYKISLFAEKLGDPRDLEFDPNGVVLVSVPSKGKVVAISGGVTNTVVSGLNRPHGLAFKDGKLYVAGTSSVETFDYDTKTFKATARKKIIDLPNDGGHFTRSIMFSSTGKLLVSTGSSCNACVETDNRRAAIFQANPDGSDFKPYATGLRNSVFMTLNPKTKEVWATDMGRDNLGDNTPSDETNIVREGGMYGWPFCYNDKVVDNEINPNGSKFDCGSSVSPQIKFQAHSAPLGLAFYNNDLLVSFHGSWNRTVPTGYKVIKVKLNSSGKEISQEDFVTGWLDGSTAKGRPVDILIDASGKIYISDDKLGVIYLVEKL